MSKGSLGYKIGKKVRLMHVAEDADLLWQICVREIYILLTHYGNVTSLREAFEDVKIIKESKQKPTKDAIKKCKMFASSETNDFDWESLTRYCQHSFINILEAGYFLNNSWKTGLTLLLDLNNETLRLFHVIDENSKNSKNNKGKKEIDLNHATLTEIMAFPDMPFKTRNVVISEMKERYEQHILRLAQIDEEIRKIQSIRAKTMDMGGEQNILEKTRTLLEEQTWERKKQEMGYRFFYHRLDALNLIDYEDAVEK
jgi:hypothetical protein